MPGLISTQGIRRMLVVCFCLLLSILLSDLLCLATNLCVHKGVPQGSNLGPFLFTILINKFGEEIKNHTIHLYADDTMLYMTEPSVGQVTECRLVLKSQNVGS